MKRSSIHHHALGELLVYSCLICAMSVCCIFAACRSGVLPGEHMAGSADDSGHGKTSKTERLDDLGWLIGSWSVVERRWLAEADEPRGSHGEHLLEYFNIYLPYADGNLTLRLTESPDGRPIAAEFLVTEEGYPPFSERKLVSMYPGGVVRIGVNRIWVGDPFNLFEFKYWFEADASPPRLRLESKHVLLDLEKQSIYPGELADSSVDAPVVAYSEERRMDLFRRYRQLSDK
jgi:hypothetical protein